MVESEGIRLQGISFRIGEFAMEDLSFAIRKGEYFVLTGPNGAGKTIVVKLIASLLEPTAGSILIDGRPISDLPPWKRNIGYVPQEGVLFPNRTVRENIQFGLEVRRMDRRTISSEVDRVASMMGIDHVRDRMPRGLSGGERQKAGVLHGACVKSDRVRNARILNSAEKPSALSFSQNNTKN